jgi:signal transduction histidine kinase
LSGNAKDAGYISGLPETGRGSERAPAPHVDLDFLHALLHDLRGPVGRVRMLGELLVRRTAGLEPETRALVGHIETSAAVAEDVLEAVRRYAEALQWVFRPTRFDLTLALNAALARLNARLANTGASVTHGALPAVYADMVQMSVLFEELIANALRFRSAEAPVIEIAAIPAEARLEGARWLVCVVDNGIGVSESAVERIFQPLAKASEHSGAGMGLAICRRIAELHGGEITAIPRPSGAEFRLCLPQ